MKNATAAILRFSPPRRRRRRSGVAVVAAVLAAVLLAASTTAVDDAATTASTTTTGDGDRRSSSEDSDDSTNTEKCGVYLAESTIPGAGLGMYNGHRYLKARDRLGPDDLVVPVLDYAMHNPQQEESFFGLYGWTCDMMQGLLEEGVEPIAWVPGTGAALNCDLALVNLVGREDRIRYDDGGLRRTNDPGAGAFTPHYGRYNVAVRTISPGEELFDSYGDGYFGDREETYGKIPLTNDYREADRLLYKYKETKQHLLSSSSTWSSSMTAGGRGSDLSGGTAAGDDVLSRDWYGVITKLSDVWPSRVLNALPKDPAKAETILEEGGTAWLNYNRTVRTIEWLEENGSCMDNIESRPSTIRQAGRGAFARRLIPKGDVVGPAPVLHFDRRTFEMHPAVYDDSGKFAIDASGPVVHYNLVLNYCYGHRNSSSPLVRSTTRGRQTWSSSSSSRFNLFFTRIFSSELDIYFILLQYASVVALPVRDERERDQPFERESERQVAVEPQNDAPSRVARTAGPGVDRVVNGGIVHGYRRDEEH